MSHESSDMDPRLERSLEEIRNEAIDPAMVEGAAQRVRSKLAAEPAHRISGCADFQALIPAWKAGELSEAKALLLKDHLHECVACRRAMEARPRPVVTLPVRPAMPPRRWLAIAAAVTVTAGLGTWGTFYRYAPAPERSRAVVESLEGTLYRVSADGASPLHRGEELAGGAEVRTGSASRAMLRLGDGSWVEMKERSAFTVSATRRELTVNLGRGSVLVQAAKRRTGHLYVASKDCRVEVTGTVFHVNGGTKGARVSVIEGEVRVSAGGDRKVLHSGDQYASNASVGTAPVEDEIAWSANIEKHMVLLREFSALGKDLAKVPLPGLRYSSRLLDLAPRRTAVFASIPNLGEALGGAHEIIRQRVQSSPVLQEWWQSDGGKHFDETIRELREVSQYLGDEIVMAASLDANGRLGA
ncbi:MAG: FecR domain-containing protein, partial [Acidobacteria bacterium]|nr:FecR domain-containing protein [Acidobacteriota bacterium]